MSSADETSEESYSLRESDTQTSGDEQYRERMSSHFRASRGTVADKLDNFSRFVSRQALSLFLAKNEIFNRIVKVHGSVVEAGVFMGGGLFTWAQLSAIYEPVNYNRKIIGFDTFDGFPNLSEQDQTGTSEHSMPGGYRFDGREELEETAALHNLTRPIGHIPKVELVTGDAQETIPRYVADNPHLVVALLYLDFDLYEPTRIALEHLYPRMPKGAVIAFDELNQKNWPGETLAVLESVGLNLLAVERVPYTPSVSFAVL